MCCLSGSSSTYNECIKPRGGENLLLRHTVQAGNPSEQGIRKSGQANLGVESALARSVESRPSRTKNTKCDKSRDAEDERKG